MPISRRQFSVLLAAVAAGMVPRVVGSRAAMEHPARVNVGYVGSAFAWMEQGAPKGIVLQAVDAVLKGMAVEPSYVLLPGGELTSALNAGLVEMVAALPAEEAGSFELSPAMVEDWDVVATEAGREFPLSRLADLQGKRLGVWGGRPLAQLDHAPGVEIHRFKRDAEVLRELVHGRLDGMVVTAYQGVAQLRAQGVLARLRLLDQAVGRQPVAAALSRVHLSPDFIADFNTGLGLLMGSAKWPALVQAAAPMEMARQWQLLG